MECSKEFNQGELNKDHIEKCEQGEGNQPGMARCTGKKPSLLLDLKGWEEGAVSHTQ